MEPDSWFRDLDGTAVMGDGGNGAWKSPSAYHGAGYKEDSKSSAPDRPPPPSSHTGSHGTGGRKPPSSSTSSPAVYKKKPLPPTTVAQAQKELSWSKLIYDYSQASSLHGLRFVTEESRFLLRRVLWFLIVGAALAYYLYYFSSRVKFFLEYNKNVNVEVNYLNPVKFPAVTFCNQNPFRITAVADNHWYYMINQHIYTPAIQETRTCTTDEFECVEDSQCIEVSMRCDLYPDCADGSDESECDPCPLVWIGWPEDNNTDLSGVINEFYVLQKNTWNSSKPVYIQRSSGDVYLYADATKWILGKAYDGDVENASVGSSASAPQYIDPSSVWTLNLPTGPLTVTNINLTCSLANMDLLKSFDSSIPNNLSLETMYDTAGHRREEFIQKCVFKGKDCSSDIHRKDTDMGVCYMFNSTDMFVEQSGPGYGLSLTVNIEQYEYTKSTDEGIGIKLLMHDPEDEPLMKEKGTSVSPGLYSFISIETTQVENLKPPWGTCGAKALEHYSTGNYTIPRCTLECELTYVNQHANCSCRDLHMPGPLDVCDVDTYTNCYKPAVAELRAAGNYCTCPTPCIADAFVPTTSFSIVLTEGGGSQNEKTIALKDKVSTARETTYRVVTDKYLETMRNFHLLQMQLTQMARYAHASKYQLDTEFDAVESHVIDTRADCIWLRDKMELTLEYIDDYFIKPLDEFKDILIVRGVTVIDEIDQLMRSAKSKVYSMNQLNQNSADYLDGIASQVWVVRSQLIESLTLMKDRLQPVLYTKVTSIPDVDQFQIKSALMSHLSPFIAHTCTWCQTAGTDSLVKLLKDKIESLVGNNLKNNLQNSRDNIDNLHDPYLIDLMVLNDTENIPYNRWTKFLNILGSGYNEAKSALSKVTSSIAFAQEAKLYIERIFLFLWNQKCRTELSKLVREYETVHLATTNLLEKLSSYMELTESKIEYLREAYINHTSTLEIVTKMMPFDNITTAASGMKVQLHAALTERILIANELHQQINSLHYVFLSVTDDSEMAGFSAYWQQFGITIPIRQHPQEYTINGLKVADDHYKTLASPAAEDHWLEIVTVIEDIQEFLLIQYDSLVEHVAAAQTYFISYMNGNELTGDFYSKNFLQVELFYKELTERKVSQQVAYAFENLLSELGGLMGLLLGASVLSICEVLDLFIYNCFRKCLRRNDKVNAKQVVPAW